MDRAEKLFSVKGKVIAIIGATGILGRRYTEFLS
ncbi:MAG: oxidoreductase, partial [Bacteroidales bacterium]|nr:oxidoreductase [Bacteroidales bacterium]